MQRFDDWFTEKHGCSFDDMHMQPNYRIDSAMRALTVALREYVTDMVTAEPKPCLHVRLRGNTCEDCGAKFEFTAE